jgi:Leucine-rich repeat (LRR) protein
MPEMMSRKHEFLLLVAFVYTTIGLINGGVQTTACPTNCTCSIAEVDSLYIDCRNRESDYHSNTSLLESEINKLLSSHSYANLSYLSITDSSLDQVPRSLCRLTKLKVLNLDRNKLSRLPDGCFSADAEAEEPVCH